MSGQLQAVLTSQLGKEHAREVYASLLEAALHLQEALAPAAGARDLGTEAGGDPAHLLEARLRNVARARALRDRLLEGGVGARQLADQLGISVQAVDQARKAEKLIALRVGGSWRYPLWQLDFSAPDPMPSRLPELAEAAGGLRLAVIRWLSEPDEVLKERPLDTLRSERWQVAVRRARQLFITAA
jgi:hypothetical protein